jgi:hypothetical protein
MVGEQPRKIEGLTLEIQKQETFSEKIINLLNDPDEYLHVHNWCIHDIIELIIWLLTIFLIMLIFLFVRNMRKKEN